MAWHVGEVVRDINVSSAVFALVILLCFGCFVEANAGEWFVINHNWLVKTCAKWNRYAFSAAPIETKPSPSS
jgi:hypothetical protein